MSKKFICTVCGYVHEGDTAPEKCPLCGAPASKFIVKDEASAEKTFAAEHVLGIAKGVDAEVIAGLQAHAQGECAEVPVFAVQKCVVPHQFRAEPVRVLPVCAV